MPSSATGANGHGAYSSNGTVLNAGSVNADKQTKCHGNSSGASTTYSPAYVEKYPTIDSANALDNFDNIVTFRDACSCRRQMHRSLPPVARQSLVADGNRVIAPTGFVPRAGRI
jgi:hypothetical protein